MMKMIKILAIIIAGIFTTSVIKDLIDNRPIKFENYKTSEELKAFLDQQYPVGSDGEKAFNDLKKSGADCEDVTHKETIPNDLKRFDYVIGCRYIDSFFSWPPLTHNRVTILGNKEKKILENSVGKFPNSW